MRATIKTILVYGILLSIFARCSSNNNGESSHQINQSLNNSSVSLADAEGIRYLSNGTQSLSALFQSIYSAEKSVDLSYYEIGPCDTSTKVILRAIKDKKMQNPDLQVRILADPAGFKNPRYKMVFAEYVYRQLGVKAKFYNDNSSVTDTSTYRNHTKIGLIDGDTNKTILITGGRNLSDAYYGLNNHKGYYQYEYLLLNTELKNTNYIDRDILITEKVDTSKNLSARGAGGQARAVFNRMWNGKVFGGPAATETERAPNDVMKKAQSCLAWGEREEILYQYLRSTAAIHTHQLKSYTCNDVNFLAGKPATEAINSLFEDTQRMSIENWAFVPSQTQKNLLNANRDRNVPITIYTNYFRDSGETLENEHLKSVGRSNGGSVRIYPMPEVPREAYAWGSFLPNLTPEFSIHSKVFVSFKENSTEVAVSSFNIDDRSERINFESAILLKDCGALGEDIEALSKELIQNLPNDIQNQMQSLMRGNIPQTTPWENLKGKVLRESGLL